MNIELITTQNDNLRESGFGEIQTCKHIVEAINSMGHKATLSVCHDIQSLDEVVARAPDLVILAIKQIITPNSETIWLCDFFTQNNINFSGSLRDTMMYDVDKILAKAYLKDKGISTPRHFTAVPGKYKRDYDMPINYPILLKPMNSECHDFNDELSCVNSFSEFENGVSSLYALDEEPVLAEEFFDGQDYSVSIIKTQNSNMLVSAMQVSPLEKSKNLFAKDTDIKVKTIRKLMDIENKSIKERVKNLAIDAYIDLDIRDFGQIHIRANKNDACFFMRVDLTPDMAEGTSLFTEAFKLDQGLNYNEIVGFIVDEGISRV